MMTLTVKLWFGVFVKSRLSACSARIISQARDTAEIWVLEAKTK